MLRCSVMCDSLGPHGLQPTRLLCPWGFSRQEYWSGLPCSPPGDLPTQSSNPGLPHCRQILYHVSHKGRPRILEWVSLVQLLSRVRLSATPWIAACQASLSITNSQSLLKLMSTELVMPSSHLILFRPLLLLPPIPPSIRVFSNESVLCIRCPKYWSFSFSIIPSNEYSVLISCRIDWLDLLAIQGTLKSLLQYHSSKASILQHSAFFIVQLSHPYMTIGKTIALTIWTFVGNVSAF